MPSHLPFAESSSGVEDNHVAALERSPCATNQLVLNMLTHREISLDIGLAPLNRAMQFPLATLHFDHFPERGSRFHQPC